MARNPKIQDTNDTGVSLQITKKEALLAIEETCGVIGDAAKELGCTRGHFYKLIKKWPELKPLVKVARKELRKLARESLKYHLLNRDRDLTKFTLSTLCKKDGFTTRTELDLMSTGEPMRIERKKLKKLSQKEIAAAYRNIK